MPIEGNEKIIDNLRKNYGRIYIIPIEDTTSISSVIGEVRRANGGRVYRNISIAKGRRGRNGRLDTVDVGRTPNRRTASDSTGRILQGEERAEIKNPFEPNDIVEDVWSKFSVKKPRKQVGTFYSNAEKAVLDVKQDKATPEQWKAMLKKNGGIKAYRKSYFVCERD